MRKTMILAAGALLAVTLTGCGKGADDTPGVATAQSGAAPTASASAATGDDTPSDLKFSKCMREQGMTWFPDPSDGKLSVHVPSSVKPEDFDAAQKACRKWAPGGEDGPKMSPEDLEKARLMAKCMRESGVPNFPDPQPNGGIHIDSKMNIDPDSPTFKAAEKKCSQYMPKGEKKEVGTGGSGA